MIDEEKKKQAFEAVRKIPYLKFLGIEPVDFDWGVAVLSLEMNDNLRQPYGLLHGGAIASLIDSATASAVIGTLGDGEQATTIDLSLQYLRPHTAGKITCTAKITRAGKRIIFVQAEVVNEEGKLIATALSTYTKI